MVDPLKLLMLSNSPLPWALLWEHSLVLVSTKVSKTYIFIIRNNLPAVDSNSLRSLTILD